MTPVSDINFSGSFSNQFWQAWREPELYSLWCVMHQHVWILLEVSIAVVYLLVCCFFFLFSLIFFPIYFLSCSLFQMIRVCQNAEFGVLNLHDKNMGDFTIIWQNFACIAVNNSSMITFLYVSICHFYDVCWQADFQLSGSISVSMSNKSRKLSEKMYHIFIACNLGGHFWRNFSFHFDL